jgi:hypothetical protein
MNTLYIIGNGFDLWHGLPTSYGEFYEFSRNILTELETYYSFDSNDNTPWHDFENALGAYDPDLFFDFYNEVDVTSDDFRPKDLYGLEDELTEQTDIHVSTIRETFIDWINQIDISPAKQQMSFPKDAQFITFNYTSTLQSIYEIETSRVLHIHGRAETLDELIFGHGENIVEPPEFDEDGENTHDMFSDAQGAARYPLYALKKPVDTVLARNEHYFQQINNIDQIVVIGHSLNKIDHPYFSRIANCAPNAHWTLCCYTEDEEETHTRNLIECGVQPDNINVITYDDLQRT